VTQCFLQAFLFGGVFAVAVKVCQPMCREARVSNKGVRSQMAGSHRMVSSATGKQNGVPTILPTRGPAKLALLGASALSHVPAVALNVIIRNHSSGLADVGSFGSRSGTGSSDFPHVPPIPLSTCADQRPTLGGLPRSTNVTGFRIRRNWISATGRDLGIANPTGQCMYSTRGDIFSWSAHTRVYSAPSHQPMAVLRKMVWTFHRIYEVASYIPVCSSQTPQDERGDDGKALYEFAQLTRRFGLYTYWDVAIRNCDGSWTTVWSVQSRYWIAWKYNYDILELNGSQHFNPSRIGTIDQSYYFSKAYYDVFGAPGVDHLLVAVAAVLMDLEHLAAEQSSKRSSGDHADGMTRNILRAINIAGTAVNAVGDC